MKEHGHLRIKTIQRLNERGVWGRMDTCACMAESLCRPPETITTLLTGYTPVKNKKFKKEIKQLRGRIERGNRYT